MKKIVLLSAVCASVFISCKKEPAIDPNASWQIMLEKSNSLNDQTIAAGTKQAEIFEFNVIIKNAPHLTITNGILRFDTSQDLMLSNLKNIFVVISDSTGELWSEKISLTAEPELSFETMRIPVENKARTDTVKIFADSDVGSNGVLTGTFVLGYETLLPGVVHSTAPGYVAGQTVTFQ